MIEVKGLSYQIGDTQILHDIHLTLENSKIVGIIGPNGGGKSTLLKHLMGILAPPKGTVLYDGQDIREWSPRKLAKNASYVFQENERQIDFTVEEMLLMGRYAHLNFLGNTGEKDRRKMEKLLQDLAIAHLRDRSINTLSGGEAQKVFIGRALMQETPILYLDEPTSMLDIHNSVELLELVSQIQKHRELLVVMVLHELNLAFHYCDHIILLDKGEVVKVDKRENVVNSQVLKETYAHRIKVVQSDEVSYIVPRTGEGGGQ